MGPPFAHPYHKYYTCLYAYQLLLCAFHGDVMCLPSEEVRFAILFCWSLEGGPKTPHLNCLLCNRKSLLRPLSITSYKAQAD